MMSFNLSLLPADEKNQIELDKQASFWVWKLKQGQIRSEEIVQHSLELSNEVERTLFLQSVDKYKKMMGVA